MHIEELLPDALHRPAPEGVRIVALWWLEQTHNARESFRDAYLPVTNLISTLRENRELLTDSPIKRELRHLRGLQHALEEACDFEAQRAWLDAEVDMLLPDARAEAIQLTQELERIAHKQSRAVVGVLRRHFDCCEQSLQSALSRFSIQGTIGVALNLDPFSAHAAGRLNRHLAKLIRALNDVQDISSKREIKRVGDSLSRIRALLFPFVGQLPALDALYQSASNGQQQLNSYYVATRLAKLARSEKLGGLSAVLEDVRLSHYNQFATRWLADKGESALSSAYAALAALQVSVDVTQLANARFTSEFGAPMEIERKFLLSGCPPEASVVAGTRIEQGWIPGRTLRERLRRSTYPTGVSRYTRTVKFGRGISRVELEEDTDRHLFEVLWPLTVSARVRKRRHAIREGAHTWEIDVFTDRDLVLAEVELSSVDDAPVIPAWLEKWIVREVTDESEFVNANLAVADDEDAFPVTILKRRIARVDSMLAALLPIRDNRDRVVAYELSAYPVLDAVSIASNEEDARSTLELLSTLPLPRLASGRPVYVPVTPGLVRDGALSRFASVDAVFVLATEALEDPATLRAVEVHISRGFHFGLDGFPDSQPLPPALAGTTIALDAARVPPLTMGSRIQLLLQAGLKPIARNVDDRATRERVLSLGVPLYSGRILSRGTTRDLEAESGAKRAVTMLAAFSDGRPPDVSFDTYVRNDARLSAEILRVMRSASLGVRGPRTVEHAFTVLGRDAILDRMTSLVARLASECAGDPELALVALRRARMCERLATALERPPHPRTRRLAGLVSILDAAFGVPASALSSHVALSPVLTDVAMDRLQPLGQLVDVIDAYDNGWWPDMRSRCHNLGVSPTVIREAYFDAWRDAREELGNSKNPEA